MWSLRNESQQIWNPTSDKKEVNIDSLRVLIWELNGCAHIYDKIVNESFGIESREPENKKCLKGYFGYFTFQDMNQ